MRLISYTTNGETRTGALRGDEVVDLNRTDSAIPTDMIALLAGGDAMMARAGKAAETGTAVAALADVRLESPVPVPPRILAVGLNYLEHFYEIPEEIREKRGMKVPEVPVIFNKQNTSATGPFDPILLPPESSEIDYEAELGVVIGKTCRRVSEAEAMQVVAGFVIVNDVTVRDWQRATPTMTMGKSWDSHCPMGPALVTPDEIDDLYALQVRLTVNGEERQQFSTGDMHFNIAQQIAHLSTAFTLVPGDVIATGTSAGVAVFRPDRPWLKDGQVVRIEIDGLGYIENPVARDTGEKFIR